ncbi:MAG: hypothetical protein RLZZ141_980 [Pseudomonadota bacterium]|jgi:hypothetical protein
MGPGQWPSATATQKINATARSDRLDLSFKLHAVDQMRLRGLVMGDVLHVLKYGFVLDDAEPATRLGFFKYVVTAETPNSDGRKIGVVVIPDGQSQLKIITVMWRD